MTAERVCWSLNRRELLKLLPPGVAGWVLGPLVGEELVRAAVGAPAVPAAEAKKWVAKWIWCEGEPVPQNFYLYCRKSFTLEGKASEATVDVTADSRYKLFVNGKFVGRGPARGDQRWQYYDTYDLASFLRAGENVVAAIVHQFGVLGHYCLGRGGFLLQGEARQSNGQRVPMETNATWRVLPSPAWDRETARATPGLMWQEIYDARVEPQGWQRPGFDDSSWQQPVILGPPPVLPWENLVPRDIPFAREEEWSPSAIVNSGMVKGEPMVVRFDVPKLLGRSDGQIAYVFAYVWSRVEQQMVMVLRKRDGSSPMFTRLWLNGQAPGQSPNPPYGPAKPVIEVPLRQGWNEFLIKLPHSAWDLAYGPVPGQEFIPIEWYAEPDTGTQQNRVWIAGPYGQKMATPLQPGSPGGPGPFLATYEPEQVVLNRTPGTPVHFPGKGAPLEFGTTKNVALLMAVENRQPQATPALRGVEKLLKPGEGPCGVSTAGAGGDPYITIDFGKEVTGYIRLRLKGAAGGIIDLGYSEVLLNGYVDPLRDTEDSVDYADRYIMRDGPQEWELFFLKGFRYLQLTFRNCPKPVELESVKLLFTSYPVKYRGAFECSDPLLTKIWDVGRWTLQLCMHDSYEDCPWREQAQWVGDAQVELQANYATFGDLKLATKYLRQIAQSQAEDGALPGAWPYIVSTYPKRTPPPPILTMTPFMAQWVSTLLEFFHFTGERGIVRELFPTVVRLMAYLDRYQDAHGLLADAPGSPFMAWASGEVAARPHHQESTAFNCFYYRSLVDAAELASLAGDAQRQAEWSHKADVVKQSINERMWSEDIGVYVQGRIGEEPPGAPGVFDSVMAAYSGVAPADRVNRSLETIFGKRAEGRNPFDSPFDYFFYLKALRRVAKHEQALEATRTAYGKMLDAGATTWWEHFSGSNSHCHGWSCAPNQDLSAYVLGVQPTAPGFAAFRVEPYPADLRWAKGVVPTVQGDVSVAWKREGSSFELTVTAPMKAVVELSVPAKSLETTRLTGKAKPQKQAFADGRARYWVAGLGTFRVLAEG